MVFATLVSLSSPSGAAGFSYGGGGTGGTNVPISTLRILLAKPLSPAALTVTIPAPSGPTTTNPGRVALKIRVPKKSFALGCTLVVAAPPASLPPLYYVNGATTFAPSTTGVTARVTPVTPVIQAAALSVRTIISVYIGVYCGKKERTAKYVHPVTLSFTSPAISTSDTLFETQGLKWGSATGDTIAPGIVSVTLNTNHALDLVNVLHNLRTVSFADNRGRGKIPPVTVSIGSRIILPKKGVTRTHYRLRGWSLNGRAPVLKSPYVVRRNVVLQAVWVRSHVATRRIAFSANGGAGALTPLSVRSGSLVALPGGNGLARAGYHFVGWSLNGRTPVLGAEYRVTTSVTLLAVWAKGPLIVDTITYLVNGGDGGVSSQRVDQGDTVVLPITGLTRAGYRFVGWSTTGDRPLISSPYLVTHSVILMAVWVKDSSATFSVEFLINGGQGSVQNASGTVGTLVALPTGAGLFRSGYTFEGWSATGTGPALVGPLVIHGNLVLKAIWRA